MAGHPVGVTGVHPGGIKTAIARNGRVLRPRGPGRRRPRIFDEKLARMTPERAAEIIVKGMLGGQAAGAGRARRPRAAPLRHASPAPATRTSSPRVAKRTQAAQA